MKLVRFSADGTSFSGMVEKGDIFELAGGDMLGQASAKDLLVIKKGKRKWANDRVKLLAPILPSKIIAIGLNYRSHAAEFNKQLPQEPMLFLKPCTAVIGNGDEIIYPSHMSKRVDYEGELAIVIGKRAKDVTPEDAKGYILGYTCFNDVTARDLQGKDIQYTRAKGFDTFAPIGPCIETELNPLDAMIETFLNGEKRQSARTSDMIFDCFFLLSFISRVMTLLPGDIIATGTPSGVGKMKPGDKVEVRIEGIGSLINTVIGGLS